MSINPFTRVMWQVILVPKLLHLFFSLILELNFNIFLRAYTVTLSSNQPVYPFFFLFDLMELNYSVEKKMSQLFYKLPFLYGFIYIQ